MSFLLSPKDLHTPTAAWYSQYLQSKKWIDFKAKLVLGRGELCEICKEKPHVSLHHKTYARLFKELEIDVVLVCKDCHHAAHKLDHIPFIFLIYEEDLEYVNAVLAFSKDEVKISTPNKRKLQT